MATRPDARPQWRADFAWGAAAVVLTCILAAVALQIWNADLRIPFSYDGDASVNQLLVKGMLDHGWYQHNPNLGAPFGLKLYDFPVVSGDNLQMVLMKAIGIFTSDSALVVNLFFLLTFPLSAATAFIAARLLGLSRTASLTVSVLFALLPYHFLHGERHLFIAAYYAVPLSAFFVVSALQGRSFNLRDRRQLALIALAVIVIGSAHVYYAAFAIALLVVAAIVRVVIGAPRSALGAVLLAVAIGAVVGANHLPNLAYRAQHGKNAAVERQPAETDKYALRLAAMVLPVPHHRIEPLAHLRARYDSDSEQLQEGQPDALGTIAAVGLVGLLVVGLATMAVPARRERLPLLVLPLAAAAVAAILIGSVGGFASVFSYVFTGQLRAWARIAVFVAFFGLLAVGLAADAVRTRRSEREALALLLAILVIGFLDQTNSGSVPAYATVKAAYSSDDAFVAGIERTLGPGASIFELPYEPFPEPQPAWTPDLDPYEMGDPYIHATTSLRWSYGLMKGRSGNWDYSAVQLPPALLARGLVAAGFSGICVGRGGYADRGAHVVAALERETGARVTSSRDGRFAFLDLRAYAQRLRGRAGPTALRALRGAVLRPIRVQFQGFLPLEQDLSGRIYRMGVTGHVLFRNPYPTARVVDLSWTLEPAVATAARVVITWPDGHRQPIVVPPAGTRLERRFALAPGQSAITLAANGQAQFVAPFPAQPYYLRVLDPLLVDDAFAPFGQIPRDHHAAAWLEPFGAI